MSIKLIWPLMVWMLGLIGVAWLDDYLNVHNSSSHIDDVIGVSWVFIGGILMVLYYIFLAFKIKKDTYGRMSLAIFPCFEKQEEIQKLMKTYRIVDEMPYWVLRCPEEVANAQKDEMIRKMSDLASCNLSPHLKTQILFHIEYRKIGNIYYLNLVGTIEGELITFIERVQRKPYRASSKRRGSNSLSALATCTITIGRFTKKKEVLKAYEAIKEEKFEALLTSVCVVTGTPDGQLIKEQEYSF